MVEIVVGAAIMLIALFALMRSVDRKNKKLNTPHGLPPSKEERDSWPIDLRLRSPLKRFDGNVASPNQIRIGSRSNLLRIYSHGDPELCRAIVIVHQHGICDIFESSSGSIFTSNFTTKKIKAENIKTHFLSMGYKMVAEPEQAEKISIILGLIQRHTNQTPRQNEPAAKNPAYHLPAQPKDIKYDGYVYCLSNPAMPGLLKIGYTTKTPEERAFEIYTGGTSGSGTGVPAKFVIEFSVKCKNPFSVEQAIHAFLAKKRYNEYREFFNLSQKDAYFAFVRLTPHPRVFVRGAFSMSSEQPEDVESRLGIGETAGSYM